MDNDGILVFGSTLSLKGQVRTLGRLMYVTLYERQKCNLNTIKDNKTIYHHLDKKSVK